jgi:hypothetical protein
MRDEFSRPKHKRNTYARKPRSRVSFGSVIYAEAVALLDAAVARQTDFALTRDSNDHAGSQ